MSVERQDIAIKGLGRGYVSGESVLVVEGALHPSDDPKGAFQQFMLRSCHSVAYDESDDMMSNI